MKKLTFIGGGNMATAIINGILNNKISNPNSIVVCDIDETKLKYFSSLGLSCSNIITKSIIDKSDIIFLAVKPQNFTEVLDQIKPFVKDQTFVTIAAGISTNFINKSLNGSYPIIRIMPNTPLLLSKGASAFSKNELVSDENFNYIKSIFEKIGVVEVIDENLMDSIISVNGSSPAYFYLMAKAMADYATTQGIDYKTALNLICATMQGSAEMLLKSNDSADELIKKVSSPGGTTLKALDVLNSNNFSKLIFDAMDACTNRAKELGK